MRDLRGKNILLTGASRGVGVFIARDLARAGANLALVARDGARLAALAAELATLGVRAVPLPADVTDGAARVSTLERAEVQLGPLDVLINNAGVERWGRFQRIGEGEVQRLVETNLVAPMELTRLVLPDMMARHRGHILTIASMAGKAPTPYNAAYSGTKAGVIAWSHALRVELKGTGVGVSVVLPTFVSGVGLHSKFHARAPRLAGEVRPGKVSQAVLKALREDRAEVQVTRMPVQPLLALSELNPGVRPWLFEKLGVHAFLRRRGEQVETNGMPEDE